MIARVVPDLGLSGDLRAELHRLELERARRRRA
jgi:hypothetical protein